MNNIQDKLTKDSWKPFYSATRLEALTYCLEKPVTSDWMTTVDDLKNFCFYFSDVLKTHLYDEKENCWLENPFDDGKFCNAMFNLLNKDKSHLSRNCVLLLENFFKNGTQREAILTNFPTKSALAFCLKSSKFKSISSTLEDNLEAK